MKEISRRGNLRIDIDDKFLDDNYQPKKSERAIITLESEVNSVLLFDIAETIEDCIFSEKGLLKKTINIKKFPQIEVFVKVYKQSSICVTYRFIIKDFSSALAILLNMANVIKI